MLPSPDVVRLDFFITRLSGAPNENRFRKVLGVGSCVPFGRLNSVVVVEIHPDVIKVKPWIPKRAPTAVVHVDATFLFALVSPFGLFPGIESDTSWVEPSFFGFFVGTKKNIHKLLV